MVFTVLSVYFFIKFIYSDNEKNLLIWSIFLTAAFLCRLESALAVWPAFLLSGFMLTNKLPKTKRFRIFAYVLSPLFVAALCYGVFFLLTHTFHSFAEAFIRSINAISNIPLNKKMAGLDDIASNLSQISISFLLNMAILVILAIICRIAATLSHDKPIAKVIIPVTTSFILFILLKQYSLYELQYRCLILVLFCGSIAYLLQSLPPKAPKRSLALMTLFMTSLLVIYRMFLATSHYWYGFYFLTLPLICYYIFFCDIVKSTLENRFKTPQGLLSTAIAVFLMLMIIPFWEHSSSNYKYHSILSTTSKGNLYSINNTQTEFFLKTVDYLKKNTTKNSTVVVFPEGVGINFFTDRATPLRHHGFLPSDITMFGEDKILTEIRSAKIDYVVILTRDTSDCGPASFGVDYAKKIQKWIDDNYVPIKQFGAKPYASNATGILILKKKS
jgi:hypothetical protein